MWQTESSPLVPTLLLVWRTMFTSAILRGDQLSDINCRPIVHPEKAVRHSESVIYIIYLMDITQELVHVIFIWCNLGGYNFIPIIYFFLDCCLIDNHSYAGMVNMQLTQLFILLLRLIDK